MSKFDAIDIEDAVAYNMKSKSPNGAETAKLVAYFQEGHGLTVDGKFGPQTLAAMFNQGAVEKPDLLRDIPSNRKDVYTTFGNPGHTRKDPTWWSENIVRFKPSGHSCNATWVNELALPNFEAAFDAARWSYDVNKIWSAVYRHMRHDPNMPLSYHSWGIAIDINPADNRARSFRRGSAPEPFSDDYYKIWPRGVTRKFVEAFKSAGFTWGCDWDNDGTSSDTTFMDPMHFQLVGPNAKVTL